MEYTFPVEKQVVLQLKTKEMCDCLYLQSDNIMYYAEQDTSESKGWAINYCSGTKGINRDWLENLGYLFLYLKSNSLECIFSLQYHVHSTQYPEILRLTDSLQTELGKDQA